MDKEKYIFIFKCISPTIHYRYCNCPQSSSESDNKSSNRKV